MTYMERMLTNVLGRAPSTIELASVLNKDSKRINQLKFYLIQEPSSLDAINTEKAEEHDEHD